VIAWQISSAERTVRTARAARRDSALRARASGTVLAFDFGTRRIGVAVGELGLGIAHPLQTISAVSDRGRLQQIGALIREWAPVLLVVGLPTHMDRTEHAMSVRCRRFAAQLERSFGIDTRLVDERLSSAAAAESLATAGVHGHRQKDLLDRVAAVHILQTFFTGCDDAA
jgi:putative pre-16S rRNA nuclease